MVQYKISIDVLPKDSQYKLTLLRKEPLTNTLLIIWESIIINNVIAITQNSNIEDILLKDISVNEFYLDDKFMCYSWKINGIFFKVAQDGSVMVNQETISTLCTHNVEIVTNGTLFIESLHLNKLHLQCPMTYILKTLVVDILEVDNTLINEGGIQVRQLIGNGTFINHARLVFVSLGVVGIEIFQNERNKENNKEAKVTADNLQLINNNTSSDKKDKFISDQFFLNEGILEAKNLVSSRSFINKGECNITETLTLEGRSHTNKGVIRADVLQIQTILTNNGECLIKSIIGQGTYINKSSLTFQKNNQCTINTFENYGELKGDFLTINSETTNLVLYDESDIKLNECLIFNNKDNMKPLELRGKISSKEVNITWPCIIQHGFMKTKLLTINGDRWHNTENAELYIESCLNLNVNLVENRGKMVTSYKILQLKGEFINFGSWSHYNGSLKIETINNKGVIIWKDSECALKMTNSGTWTMQNVTGTSQILLHNTRTVLLKESRFEFINLINNKNLVFSGGCYLFCGTFSNTGLLSLIEYDWKITDDAKFQTNVLIFRSCSNTCLGELEVEKDLSYDLSLLPNLIRSSGNIYFSEKHASQRRLDQLLSIDCLGTVVFYTTSITTTKNYEISKINNLSLFVNGIFITQHYLKTHSLRLIVSGKIVCGLDNSKFGTIATLKGSLEIQCENFDGRFAKIYSAGSTKITATTDIKIGASIRGECPPILRSKYPATVTDKTINISNGAFVRSNDLLELYSPNGNIFLYYCTLVSIKQINLIAKTTIHNNASPIYGSSLYLKTDLYEHIRDPFPMKGNNVSCPWYSGQTTSFPGSAPAMIECLQRVELLATKIINKASIIRSGKDIIINNTNTKTRISTGYIEEAIPLLHGALNHTYNPSGTYSSFTYSSEACVLQAGISIQINTGQITMIGNVNSPVITICATQDALFSNPNPYRTKTEIGTLFINLSLFLKNSVFDPVTQEIFPLGKPHVLSPNQMLLMDGSDPALLKVMNPERSLSSELLNFAIQSALSYFTGSIHNNCNLIHLEHNSCEHLRKTKNKVVRKEDAIERTMILHELKRIGSIIQQQMYLCVPPTEINPYQATGDISGAEVTIHTEGKQTHLNNRIVAKNLLSLSSKTGNINRATEKFTVSNGLSTFDVAMPQQQFICQEGNVEIKAHKDLSSIGTLTSARGSISEIAQTGNICKSPLVLSSTTRTRYEEESGLFEKTERLETSVTTSFIPCLDIVGSNIQISAPNGKVHLIGTKQIAREDIIVKAKILTVEAALAINLSESTFTTSTPFSEQSSSTSVSNAVFEKAEITAKRIVLNVENVTFKGTDFAAMILEDNSLYGATFAPTIGVNSYTSKITCKSPLSCSEAGCAGWYETLIPCRLEIAKIIRKVDQGEIKFISVDWNRNRTEIIGKFAETVYYVQKFHTEWSTSEQVIPDALLIVAAFGVALATYGTGGELLALISSSVAAECTAMASAAFTGICSMATTSFLRKGDPIATFKELFSKENLITLAINTAAAGICCSLSEAWDISLNPSLGETSTFSDFVSSQALKSGISTALNIAVGREIENIGTQLITNSVAAWMSYNIGADMDMPSESKDVSHFGVGALLGAVLNPDCAVAGAITGGINATVVAHISREFKDIDVIKLSSLLATSITAFVSNNPDLTSTAITTISNTTENNCIPTILKDFEHKAPYKHPSYDYYDGIEKFDTNFAHVEKVVIKSSTDKGVIEYRRHILPNNKLEITLDSIQAREGGKLGYYGTQTKTTGILEATLRHLAEQARSWEVESYQLKGSFVNSKLSRLLTKRFPLLLYDGLSTYVFEVPVSHAYTISNRVATSGVATYPICHLDTAPLTSCPYTVGILKGLGVLGVGFALWNAHSEIQTSSRGKKVEAVRQTALIGSGIASGLALGKIASVGTCAILGTSMPAIAPVTVPVCVAAFGVIGAVGGSTLVDKVWESMDDKIGQNIKDAQSTPIIPSFEDSARAVL
jgi:hypothetical protein